MSHWGAAWLIAAAFAGAGPVAHVSTPAQATPSLAFVSTSPVLHEAGHGSWTTTVGVSDSSGCLGKRTYWLVTTSPDGRFSTSAGTAANQAACPPGTISEVAITFDLGSGLASVPSAAALVLNQPAASTAPPATVSLTVQRDVPGFDYLWIPLITGLVAAFLFIVLAGAIGLPYRDKLNEAAYTVGFFRGNAKQFWTMPVYASAAWTFNDSWATTITAFAAAVAGLLTAAGTFSSIFPGVQLGRFALMNVACGGIVVIPPLLFGVLNAVCSRHRDLLNPDGEVEIKKGHPAAIISPAGATISFAGGGTFGTTHIKAGGAIPVPPGSKVKIARGTMALWGTSDITVSAGCKLSISKATAIKGSDVKAASSAPGGPEPAVAQAAGDVPLAAAPDMEEVVLRLPMEDVVLGLFRMQQQDKATPAPDDTPVRKREVITATHGARITVVGTADIKLPRTSEVATRGQSRQLGTSKLLTIPAGPKVIAADMRALLPTGALTIFGIATLVGLLTVLVGFFSDADLSGRVVAFVVGVLLVIGVLIYGAVANRALADPTPGSSLSAESTSSFTL